MSATSIWHMEVSEAIDAFVKTAALARLMLAPSDLEVEFLPAPHKQPSNLRHGTMAVYGFWSDGHWLKIGKAGTNSAARFTSQHYNPNSAKSTLARSLQNDSRMIGCEGFDPKVPGDWIRASTHRVNIYLSSEQPKEALSFLEAFLHLRLRPRYER